MPEDERREVPPRDAFFAHWHRPLPYIYSSSEIARLMQAAGQLRLSKGIQLERELGDLTIPEPPLPTAVPAWIPSELRPAP